ncbi:MAG: hypothetical protein WCI09_04260, partial [Planctomycetota bacterium]
PASSCVRLRSNRRNHVWSYDCRGLVAAVPQSHRVLAITRQSPHKFPYKTASAGKPRKAQPEAASDPQELTYFTPS